MQLTVWGDVAERLLPLAQRLVDEAPENQFPIVRIQEVMVSKMPATIRDVVKLQGSLSTQLVPTRQSGSLVCVDLCVSPLRSSREFRHRTCETLQIAPQLHQLVTSFQEIANKACVDNMMPTWTALVGGRSVLMLIPDKAAPFTLHVCGTVVSRSELRFTQQDVPLQEAWLCSHDRRGYFSNASGSASKAWVVTCIAATTAMRQPFADFACLQQWDILCVTRTAA